MGEFEQALKTVKESIRRTGRNKYMADRTCFKGLSYQIKCLISDYLAIEALSRHHDGFNKMKGR